VSDIDWEIRPYEESDASAVRALLVASFETATEADLAEALRADGDAEIELVADHEGEVLGYIILSPMQSPERSLGLGPVATSPNHRKQGIAASLIESGLGLATANDLTTVFLLGNPQFYEQFGFSVDAAAAFSSPYNGEFWQMATLDEEEAPTTGKADYAKAFSRFA